jgi:hypothetical protein
MSNLWATAVASRSAWLLRVCPRPAGLAPFLTKIILVVPCVTGCTAVALLVWKACLGVYPIGASEGSKFTRVTRDTSRIKKFTKATMNATCCSEKMIVRAGIARSPPCDVVKATVPIDQALLALRLATVLINYVPKIYSPMILDEI